MSDENTHIFIRWFIKRIFSGSSIIDNSALPAGSPMYYYCDYCGEISDTKSEDYISKPIKICEDCQKLIDIGLMAQAIDDAEKEATEKYNKLDEAEAKLLRNMIRGEMLREWRDPKGKIVKIELVHNGCEETQEKFLKIIENLDKLGFLLKIRHYHCDDYVASKAAELLK